MKKEQKIINSKDFEKLNKNVINEMQRRLEFTNYDKKNKRNDIMIIHFIDEFKND